MIFFFIRGKETFLITYWLWFTREGLYPTIGNRCQGCQIVQLKIVDTTDADFCPMTSNSTMKLEDAQPELCNRICDNPMPRLRSIQWGSKRQKRSVISPRWWSGWHGSIVPTSWDGKPALEFLFIKWVSKSSKLLMFVPIIIIGMSRNRMLFHTPGLTLGEVFKRIHAWFQVFEKKIVSWFARFTNWRV